MSLYMGVGFAMRKGREVAKLWITREKLWKKPLFWGKLAYLCEFKMDWLPPDMGGINDPFPYACQGCGKGF